MRKPLYPVGSWQQTQGSLAQRVVIHPAYLEICPLKQTEKLPQCPADSEILLDTRRGQAESLLSLFTEKPPTFSGKSQEGIHAVISTPARQRAAGWRQSRPGRSGCPGGVYD